MKSKKYKSKLNKSKTNTYKIDNLKNGRSHTGGFMYGKDERSNTYTSETAFKYFMNNLRSAKILTNSSISCITLLLELNTDTARHPPYFHTRRTLFNQPMTHILLKIFLRSNDRNQYSQLIPDARNPADAGYAFEINPGHMIREEAELQNTIYKETFLTDDNYLDPFVPAILGYIEKFENNVRDMFPSIQAVFRDRQRSSRDINKVISFINTGFATGYGLSIILMEFMEGYDTLYNVLSNPTYTSDVLFKYKNYILYELTKLLNRMNIVHGDIHAGNCMINTRSLYFTEDNTSDLVGRGLIIDFGRITKARNKYPSETQPISTIRTYYDIDYLNRNGRQSHFTRGIPFLDTDIYRYRILEENTRHNIFTDLYNRLARGRLDVSTNYRRSISLSDAKNTELRTALDYYDINLVAPPVAPSAVPPSAATREAAARLAEEARAREEAAAVAARVAAEARAREEARVREEARAREEAVRAAEARAREASAREAAAREAAARAGPAGARVAAQERAARAATELRRAEAEVAEARAAAARIRLPDSIEAARAYGSFLRRRPRQSAARTFNVENIPIRNVSQPEIERNYFTERYRNVPNRIINFVRTLFGAQPVAGTPENIRTLPVEPAPRPPSPVYVPPPPIPSEEVREQRAQAAERIRQAEARVAAAHAEARAAEAARRAVPSRGAVPPPRGPSPPVARGPGRFVPPPTPPRARGPARPPRVAVPPPPAVAPPRVLVNPVENIADADYRNNCYMNTFFRINGLNTEEQKNNYIRQMCYNNTNHFRRYGTRVSADHNTGCPDYVIPYSRMCTDYWTQYRALTNEQKQNVPNMLTELNEHIARADNFEQRRRNAVAAVVAPSERRLNAEARARDAEARAREAVERARVAAARAEAERVARQEARERAVREEAERIEAVARAEAERVEAERVARVAREAAAEEAVRVARIAEEAARVAAAVAIQEAERVARVAREGVAAVEEAEIAVGVAEDFARVAEEAARVVAEAGSSGPMDVEEVVRVEEAAVAAEEAAIAAEEAAIDAEEAVPMDVEEGVASPAISMNVESQSLGSAIPMEEEISLGGNGRLHKMRKNRNNVFNTRRNKNHLNKLTKKYHKKYKNKSLKNKKHFRKSKKKGGAKVDLKKLYRNDIYQFKNKKLKNKILNSVIKKNIKGLEIKM